MFLLTINPLAVIILIIVILIVGIFIYIFENSSLSSFFDGIKEILGLIITLLVGLVVIYILYRLILFML